MKKLFSLLFFASLVSHLNAADSPRVTKKTAAQCRNHLEKIYSAIQLYRIENQKLPDHFSDLIPKFISDKRIFLCPEEERAETEMRHAPWKNQFRETTFPSDYIYEFSAHPISGNFASGSITMAQWKSLQMAVVGGIVPVVRCHSHMPVLNISFDGKFFESPREWEDTLPNKMKFSDLTPSALQARFNICQPVEPAKK